MMYKCWEYDCNKECFTEMHDEVNCIMHELGCVEDQYKEECISDECEGEALDLFKCLESKGEEEGEMIACGNCLQDAIDSIPMYTDCAQLKDKDFCNAVQSCAHDTCHDECSDKLHVVMACIVNGNCNGNYYDSQCPSGI